MFYAQIDFKISESMCLPFRNCQYHINSPLSFAIYLVYQEKIKTLQIKSAKTDQTKQVMNQIYC